MRTTTQTTFLLLIILLFATGVSAGTDGGSSPLSAVQEYIKEKSQLDVLRKEYKKAVVADDQEQAVKISRKILNLLEKMSGANQKQVAVESYIVGYHSILAGHPNKAIPYLRRTIHILPESDLRNLKPAYEALLVSRSLSAVRVHRDKLDKTMRKFYQAFHSLSCLVLPPVPDNMPVMDKKGKVEFPESARRKGLAGWALITYTINKKGDLVDPHFVSIWPKKYLEKTVKKWMHSSHYKPPIHNGNATRLENVPQTFIFILSDLGLRPPFITYEQWEKEEEDRWNKDEYKDINCADRAASNYTDKQ